MSLTPTAITYLATAGPAFAGYAAHHVRSILRDQNAARDRGEWCGKWGCDEAMPHEHTNPNLSKEQFGGHDS